MRVISHLIISQPTAGDRMGRDMIKLKYEAYEKLIKHNIDYDLPD